MVSGTLDWGIKLGRPAQVKHIEGTVDTTATMVSFNVTSDTILIVNESIDKTLYVSFDDGVTWKALAPKGALAVEVARSHVHLMGSDTNTEYHILVVY